MAIEVIERFDYLKTLQMLCSFLDQLQDVACHCILAKLLWGKKIQKLFPITGHENLILNCLFQVL